MEGKYDPKEAFEKYKKEQEEAGAPIDPRAVAAGEKEMGEGRKSDFTVYKDEPSKSEKFKNDPEGELFATDLTPEELKQEIDELVKARGIIVSFLENPNIENFEITKETNLFDLEEEVREEDDLRWAVGILGKHDFDGFVTLFDLPKEIKEMIEKETIILEHLQRKST